MSLTLAAGGSFSSSPLWYITRSTGIAAFVVLTVTTMLGVAATQRSLASPLWPRFATQHLHRNVSLLGMGLVLVHIVTTLLDSYVSVGWPSWVIPFWSPYRTTGVALGTIAFDLLLVVVCTSLVRLRLSPRAWRAVHLTTYGAWPLALVHFLVTGTESAHGRWGIWLGVVCAAAVVAAVAVRLSTPNPPQAVASVRTGALR